MERTATSAPIVINYLLEDTPLFGGVKVVLRQADLLTRRGHQVRVVSPGPPPDWYPLESEFHRVPDLSRASVPPADLQIATYWTTIEPAFAATGQAVHYCQGFEASYTHNREDHPRILDAYSRPVPALSVSDHLTELLRTRFGRPARTVRQPLEPVFGQCRRERFRPQAPPRVLLMSPFEIDWKGVETGLVAVRTTRAAGRELELVRISQWAQTETERQITAADEFHCHLEATDVAEIMASCDLLIAPSWEQEGFGLPVLEAMAGGVPVVASDIAAYRGFASPAARLVPVRDAPAFAREIQDLLWGDPPAWLAAREAGLAVAADYREDLATADAEQALLWAYRGQWRGELGPPAPEHRPEPDPR